jgi:3-deoxy-D-manno-octulosonic-acid transferase
MPYLLNLLYLLALLLASPWLVYKAITTGKYRVGMWRKLWGLTPVRSGDRPCVWFHAVSVGEVLLLRQVIARFRARWPHWECVLSTTTNTGYDVAIKSFPDLCVFYWPFDFTWAVRRALARIRPSLVVLAELELWPNSIFAAKRQVVPVVVINGRMSPRSYRGYARIRWLMRRVLEKIDLFAMQNEDYAQRIRALGATAERVIVTGSVKYDGVNTERDNPKTSALARVLGVEEGTNRRDAEDAEKKKGMSSPRPLRLCGESSLVWLVGSTQAPEEEIVLDIYRKAKDRFPGLRLILVPRHKERFEEVAELLAKSGLPFLRRSQIVTLSPCHLVTPSSCPRIPPSLCPPVLLLDTLGELSAVWGLADVAFVGGSLTQRGGQNMIEPAAYGAAVTFGPHVWNFQETVDRLLEHKAAIQVADAAELERVTLELLGEPERRRQLGDAARRFVVSQQGATERTLDLLARFVDEKQIGLKVA